MIRNKHFEISGRKIFRSLVSLTLILISFRGFSATAGEALKQPLLKYSVSMADMANHQFHVELNFDGWYKDTLSLAMPQWMPGYYQIMNYSKEVTDFKASESNGRKLRFSKTGENGWMVFNGKESDFSVSYNVKAVRKFVANSYLDSQHGYIIPAATFLYIPGHLDIPVTITVTPNKNWTKVATGLDLLPGKTNEFRAADFDVLYDSPILTGNLDELPSFTIYGVKHRFEGYNIGRFDQDEFIAGLSKVVKAGIDIIGDIPYKEYIFIGIGPGFGGIEHSNNCTVSFNGGRLDKREELIRVMNFLSHEYFHLYNVKRIRPFELGPFDYGKENRTNLLWVSEGFTVYYEYLILKRSGLADMNELFAGIEKSINAYENDPGRSYQTLAQASYDTWSDGPFGNMDPKNDRSISVYDKGAVTGLILDLAIRKASGNRKSLDDVMRYLYNEYYRKDHRGFTDAEFQEACESAAGTSLDKEFEYVYTTRQIDYDTYLSYAGLKATKTTDPGKGTVRFILSVANAAGSDELAIRKSWLGE